MMDNKRTILPAQRIEVDRLATHMAKLLAALVSTATGSEREIPIARLATVLVQAHSMLLEGERDPQILSSRQLTRQVLVLAQSERLWSSLRSSSRATCPL